MRTENKKPVAYRLRVPSRDSRDDTIPILQGLYEWQDTWPNGVKYHGATWRDIPIHVSFVSEEEHNNPIDWH